MKAKKQTVSTASNVIDVSGPPTGSQTWMLSAPTLRLVGAHPFFHAHERAEALRSSSTDVETLRGLLRDAHERLVEIDGLADELADWKETASAREEEVKELKEEQKETLKEFEDEKKTLRGEHVEELLTVRDELNGVRKAAKLLGEEHDELRGKYEKLEKKCETATAIWTKARNEVLELQEKCKQLAELHGLAAANWLKARDEVLELKEVEPLATAFAVLCASTGFEEHIFELNAEQLSAVQTAKVLLGI